MKAILQTDQRDKSGACEKQKPKRETRDRYVSETLSRFVHVVCACVRVCVCACVRVCACARVRVCARAVRTISVMRQ